MKNKLSTLLPGLIGLLFLCSDGFAFIQNDPWQASIQAGNNALAQRQFADADRAFREAMRISERFKEKDPRIAIGLIRLAEACQFQSKHEEASALASRSLIALEKATKGSKPKDPSEAMYRTETSAMILDKAVGIFMAGGKYSEAEQACKRLIEIRTEAAQMNTSPKSNDDYLKFLGQALTNAQGTVADAYDKLAALYFVQHRFENAEPLYLKSLAVRKGEHGEDTPPVAVSLSNLATLYAAQGKFDKAEPLYAQAVRIFEQANWVDRPEVVSTLENYSLLLRKTGHEAEAAAMREKARAIKAKLQQSNR